MESVKSTQKIVEMFDPMFGAALVTEDGEEQPITMGMVDECLDRFVVWEEETGQP